MLPKKFLAEVVDFTIEFSFNTYGVEAVKRVNVNIWKVLETMRLNCESRDPTRLAQSRVMGKLRGFSTITARSSVLTSFATTAFADSLCRHLPDESGLATLRKTCKKVLQSGSHTVKQPGSLYKSSATDNCKAYVIHFSWLPSEITSHF